MAALIEKIEAAHRKELKAVKADAQATSTRLTAGETSLSTLGHRVTTLEHSQWAHSEALVIQQLHLEDIEDRSHRNNFRLRGLPEATAAEDLADTAIAIFRSIAGVELPDRVQLDRINRALGPKSTDPLRSHDVICRLHHYTHKEHIARKSLGSGQSRI